LALHPVESYDLPGKDRPEGELYEMRIMLPRGLPEHSSRWFRARRQAAPDDESAQALSPVRSCLPERNGRDQA